MKTDEGWMFDWIESANKKCMKNLAYLAISCEWKPITVQIKIPFFPLFSNIFSNAIWALGGKKSAELRTKKPNGRMETISGNLSTDR